jgi:hypothetical protein
MTTFENIRWRGVGQIRNTPNFRRTSLRRLLRSMPPLPREFTCATEGDACIREAPLIARGGHQPASHSVVASRMRSAYDLGDFHPMVGRLLLSVRRCVYRSGCAAVAPRVPPREWVQFLSRSPGLTAPSSRLELWRTDFGGRVASCLKSEETKNGAARGRC